MFVLLATGELGLPVRDIAVTPIKLNSFSLSHAKKGVLVLTASFNPAPGYEIKRRKSVESKVALTVSPAGATTPATSAPSRPTAVVNATPTTAAVGSTAVSSGAAASSVVVAAAVAEAKTPIKTMPSDEKQSSPLTAETMPPFASPAATENVFSPLPSPCPSPAASRQHSHLPLTKGFLQVTVCQAALSKQSLPCNPYVKLNCNMSKAQTGSVSNSTTPTFSADVYYLQVNDVQKQKLSVRIKDKKHTFRGNEVLGECEIPLSSIGVSNPLTHYSYLLPAL